MKKEWQRILLAAGVALLGGTAGVFADQGSSTGGAGRIGGTDITCPNVRACNVPVLYRYSGHRRRCGIGIRLFGVGGSLFGQLCYEHQTMIPAHQVCHGAENEGTRCVKESDMMVKTRDCQCEGLLLPFVDTGVTLRCKCGEYMNAGTVEDFMTQNC